MRPRAAPRREKYLRELDKSAAAWGLYSRKRNGRSLNLDELFERHGESLYRYLIFKLASAEDAEDVLQEAFCRFARYDLRWKLVRNPQAFVFKIARNEANRFLRRKLGRREGERMIATGGIGAFTAAFMAPDEPSADLLLQRAQELPVEQKEVVYLKIFDGLTFQEIASVCGVSANTAASRYRYGIEKLRAAVEGKR
jgi:RNA polymerase sigma-70 factor (ECF subfamily)